MQQSNVLKRFYPIILLAAVVLASASMLSLVNIFASGKIKEQEDAAVLAPLKDMFPNMTGFTSVEDVFVLKAGDQTIGYAFVAAGNGYKGSIKIVVALENETTIKGIVVISQSETPGLGSRITLPAFTKRFAGKAIEDIRLSSEGGSIDAIAGSTISSRAVVEAVRNTALAKVQALPEE